MFFLTDLLSTLPVLPDRFHSRKFWVTLGTGFIIVFGEAVGIDLDEAQVWQLVGLVATYLGVQGAADFKSAI
jgi:hypothetical protein